MNIPASAKYAIIREMSQKEGRLLNVAGLCAAAGVSRSGYYHYLKSEDNRQQREKQDRDDFLLIVTAYKYRGYNKGARGIYMRLLHMIPPVHIFLRCEKSSSVVVIR